MHSGGDSLTAVRLRIHGILFGRCIKCCPSYSLFFGDTASSECIFYKALFFIALPTRFRTSELCALTRAPLTLFALDFSSVSLAPNLSHLTKNKKRPSTYAGRYPFLVEVRCFHMSYCGSIWTLLLRPLFLLWVLARFSLSSYGPGHCCEVLLRLLIRSSVWLLHWPS